MSQFLFYSILFYSVLFYSIHQLVFGGTTVAILFYFQGVSCFLHPLKTSPDEQYVYGSLCATVVKTPARPPTFPRRQVPSSVSPVPALKTDRHRHHCGEKPRRRDPHDSDRPTAESHYRRGDAEARPAKCPLLSLYARCTSSPQLPGTLT